MPLALLAALAASLITHVTALFLPEGDWLPASHEKHEETQVPLQAELQIPAGKVAKPAQATKPSQRVKPVPKLAPLTPLAADASTPATEIPAAIQVAETPAPIPSPPGGSPRGSLSYRIYKGSQGFEVGRSVHQWEISETGYKLSSSTETTGLAGLFYPVKIELRSTGEFGSEGFIPEHFRTLKRGSETNENADFDWANRSITLTRDGKTRSLAKGSQDLLSFPFQLAYRVSQLGTNETIFPMHVASGKRYDPFNFTVQGEELLVTRAGSFRTLHLQATAPNNSADTTDIWLAIERQWLAVKIRFTDRHGDSFEQVIDALQTIPTSPPTSSPLDTP
ncbi:MAG: hypothetical protein RIR18_1613 [Pseudomonadota bacterium]|jgi:hypothetical protein